MQNSKRFIFATSTLRQGEIEAEFGEGRLRFVLSKKAGSNRLAADFGGASITVCCRVSTVFFRFACT
jgi:hypothetical protein